MLLPDVLTYQLFVKCRIVSRDQDSLISEWRILAGRIKKSCDQLLLQETVFENVIILKLAILMFTLVMHIESRAVFVMCTLEAGYQDALLGLPGQRPLDCTNSKYTVGAPQKFPLRLRYFCFNRLRYLKVYEVCVNLLLVGVSMHCFV